MRRAFASADVGQLPALLLSLRLMNQPIVHATTSEVVATLPAQGGAAFSSTVASAGRRLRSGGGHAKNHSGVGAQAQRLVIPTVTLHTAHCRVRYSSLLLRSDPSESVDLSKQDLPAHARWARGGPHPLRRGTRVVVLNKGGIGRASGRRWLNAFSSASGGAEG